jgi:hypothetical protein
VKGVPAFLLACTLLLHSLACASEKEDDNVSILPRLIVVITVDQMRADYIDRFADLF